jgi:hypothetical protein
MGTYGFLWQADLGTAEAIFRQGLTSRIITAKHAALAMMPAKRGLIVEVTENDMIGGGGNPMSQAVKNAQKSAAAALGGRARAAWHHRHGRDAWFPAIGVHAAALRALRKTTERRSRQELES